MKLARKNISLHWLKLSRNNFYTKDMANIFKSSIGKKLIMSISGLFLILFLLLHATINFLAVFDAFGPNWGNEAEGLFGLGCWFMSTPVVTVMVPILAFGFIIHIIYAIYLTLGNIKARGGYKRYAVSNKAETDSWASKNMLVLGIIVLGALALHLTHFWAKMQLLHFQSLPQENPYTLLELTFQNWWMVLIYLIWFGALWFHLTHGFWSALQTMGLNNSIWIKRLKVISNIVATIIFLMFATIAIIVFLKANSLLWFAA